MTIWMPVRGEKIKDNSQDSSLGKWVGRDGRWISAKEPAERVGQDVMTDRSVGVWEPEDKITKTA